MQRILHFFTAAIVIPSGLVVFLSQVAPWWWPGELCCHWTLHAACGLIIGAVVWRRSNALSRACVVLMILGLIPWIRSAFDERTKAPEHPTLSVLWNNLYRYNEHRAEALDGIANSKADLIGLTEVLPADRAAFAHWPYQLWTPTDGLNACALLSTKPIIISHIRSFEQIEVIDAVVDLGARPLRVLVCHLSAPLNVEWAARRDRQMHEIAALVNQAEVPTIVMGDFNATPAIALWQPWLKATHLLRAPGLTPATWPAWSSPWPRCPGIPIDHIFVRRGRLAPLETVWVPGSDHLGLSTIWAAD